MLGFVIEDDEEYSDIIAHTLERDGHSIVRVDTCRAALKLAERRMPDFAIIDVMLPDGSGYDVCRRLRERDARLAVLFLSSLDRASDIMEGLNVGGDDYLTKPFHPGELLARLKAVLRRSGAGKPTLPGAERVAAHGLEVDLTNQAVYLGGVDLGCTSLEVDILAQLVRYPGQALSHAYLTEQIWGYKNVDDATLLKGHISSIRKKIREAGGPEDMVRTVHGVGYAFTPV
jgi:DNA-binding response OmpR family regulator